MQCISFVICYLRLHKKKLNILWWKYAADCKHVPYYDEVSLTAQTDSFITRLDFFKSYQRRRIQGIIPKINDFCVKPSIL